MSLWWFPTFLLFTWSQFYNSATADVVFPGGTPLTSIFRLQASEFKSEELTALATLQGVVAKHSSRHLYFDDTTVPWLDFLASRYGVSVKDGYPSFEQNILEFKPLIKGYVLYDAANNPQSRNVATSLSGPLSAIAVDVSLMERLESLGLEQLADVRTLSEGDAYVQYFHLMNQSYAAELSPDLALHMRDYASLGNLFTFYTYEGDEALRLHIGRGFPSNGGLFGYTDVRRRGEYLSFLPVNQLGIFQLGADMATNLSTLSSVREEKLVQTSRTDTFEVKPNQHYVTFLMSDGDNAAYSLWTMAHLFQNPNRGAFSVGWGILASLSELAAPAMRWYYENAANSDRGRDHFIAQGGIAGIYPSAWPPERLASHIQSLDRLLEKSDLRLLQIIDLHAFDRDDIWGQFLALNSLDGIFYNNYGGPNTGRIQFIQGKPVIDIRDVLWEGITTEAELAKRINQAPRNPYSPEGYTAVLVHVWSKNLANIHAAIDLFAPHVRVLAPDEFVAAVKDGLN